VLRVDQIVARVLRDLELVAERDRVERARKLAVAAEDAAAHVDLVDACVALSGRDAVVDRVLVRHDTDAVRRTRGRAERAPDALLEAVFMTPEPVAAAEARVERPLVLGILLGDRLLEDLPERDREPFECSDRLRHCLVAPFGRDSANWKRALISAGPPRARPGRLPSSRSRGGAVQSATTRMAVTTALTVAAGSRIFQPNRISWS